MSKLWATIKKNITVLLRDRVAAFTVLIAPLLIVLLVGFAYSSSGTADLLVGVDNQTSSSYVDAITEEEAFQVVSVSSKRRCTDRIKRGIFDACIDVDEGNTTQVRVTVDESRSDIARTVESSLRRELSEASSKERRKIVERRYQNLTSLSVVVSRQIRAVDDINESVSEAITLAENIQGTNEVLAASADVGDLDDAIDDVDDDASSLETSLRSLRSAADNFTGSGDVSNSSEEIAEFGELENASSNAGDTLSSADLDGRVEALENQSDAISEAFSEQSQAVSTANDRLEDARDEAKDIEETLVSIQANVSTLRGELVQIRNGLSRLAGQDVEEVANPLQTSIYRVGQSGFSFGKTTPYLISIETFLFALLLGGAIAFNQNMSAAANRELLAPVGSITRVSAAVFTGLMISLLQTLLTAGAAIGHLQLWSVKIPTVLAFLILAGLMSLLLGVILGQVFETMQGLLLGALATGTVFISFSDFVSPLERFHPVAEMIGTYNPFTVAVEALRRSMFFDTTMQDLLFEASLLVGVVVALGVVAVTLQYRWKRDSTDQQRSALVRARMEVGRVGSGEDLVEWLNSVSYRTYRSLRGDIKDVLEELGVDVRAPWFRKQRLADEVQSSSSMSSMSSSESKSSSSDSSSSSDEDSADVSD